MMNLLLFGCFILDKNVLTEPIHEGVQGVGLSYILKLPVLILQIIHSINRIGAIVKPESEVPKSKVPKSRSKGLGLTQ